VPKSKISFFFPTQVFRSQLLESFEIKNLLKEAALIRANDPEGRLWSKKNYPGGFTTYGSIDRIDLLSSSFLKVRKKLDKSVVEFSKHLDLDLKNFKLELTQMWLNIQEEGGHHSAHIHPLSVVSGTFYLKIPKLGASLKLEDPRLVNFMGSAPRKIPCRIENERWVDLNPKPGEVILFESWLKHEVPLSRSSLKDPRVSISFNYS
jgi:uncharacterized protein (TIGR02466 family)